MISIRFSANRTRFSDNFRIFAIAIGKFDSIGNIATPLISEDYEGN